MRIRQSAALLLLLILFVIGGSSFASPPDMGAPYAEPRPPGGDPPIRQAATTAEKDSDGIMDPRGASVITMRQALSLALMNNPELAAFSQEVRARDAAIIQAGLLPNPELSGQLEEFGGSGERSGMNSAQSTLQIGQVILLGGKRAKQVRLAASERDLAALDYEARRLDVLTDVTKAFVDVLAAQEQVALTAELVEVARGVHLSAAERVKAGKVAPLAEIKALVEFTNAGIEQEKAQRGLDASKRRLSTLWGQSEAFAGRAEGAIAEIAPIPALDRIEPLIAQNPDVARWEKEMEQRSAASALEKARAIPDVTVSAGWQRFQDDGENTAVVGFSIPLPLFDRNQGAILEATRREAKAREEARAARMKVLASLADSYQSLASSLATAAGLRDRGLPAAQLAFRTAMEGYQMGKFGFLEVLDAKRTLFETRGRYIDALAGYHKARAEVERLLGESLDAVK